MKTGRDGGMKLQTAGAIVALTLAAGAAQAQLSTGGGPISVTADNLEVLDAQNQAIYRGNVEAVQDRNRMRADVMTLFFGARSGAATQNVAGNMGDFERLEATGKVYFVSTGPDGKTTQVITGDRAVYVSASDTVTVTGNVILTQGQNVLQGSTLVLDNRTGRATLDAAAGQNGGRVRGVFYPERQPGGAQRR